MLRNHCGWAWRRFVAFLLLLFCYSATAHGGFLTGLTPIRPITPLAPSYSISGYLENFDGQGVSQKAIFLTDSTKDTQSEITTTFSGYYDFTGLVAGDVYSLTGPEVPGFDSTGGTVGFFRTSSGVVLSPPAGASNGQAFGDVISGIQFEPSSSGMYSAVNYDFGLGVHDFVVAPGLPGKPIIPGRPTTGPIPSLNTTLSLVGTNDRIIAGPGGTLGLIGSVINSGTPGSAPLNWQIKSLSSGVSLAPSSGTAAVGSPSSLAGMIDGSVLSTGIQFPGLSVTGRFGTTGPTNTANSSVQIDAVVPRTVSAGSTIAVPSTLGGLLYGAQVPTSYSVTSSLDSNRATSVYVTGGTSGSVSAFDSTDGTTNVGQVTVGQTLVNSGGPTVVPVTIIAVPSYFFGPVNGSASLGRSHGRKRWCGSPRRGHV